MTASQVIPVIYSNNYWILEKLFTVVKVIKVNLTRRFLLVVCPTGTTGYTNREHDDRSSLCIIPYIN